MLFGVKSTISVLTLDSWSSWRALNVHVLSDGNHSTRQPPDRAKPGGQAFILLLHLSSSLICLNLDTNLSTVWLIH